MRKFSGLKTDRIGDEFIQSAELTEPEQNKVCSEAHDSFGSGAGTETYNE